MNASDKIKKFMQKQEGFRANAYKPLPTDRPTIGYGNTYYADGSAVEMGDVIDEPSAAKLFNIKVDNLAKLLSTITNPNCTQNQFDAVLSLCYNIGLPAFKNSETGALFKEGKNISDRFILWNKSGGQTVIGLSARRIKEREIYEHNVYDT